MFIVPHLQQPSEPQRGGICLSHEGFESDRMGGGPPAGKGQGLTRLPQEHRVADVSPMGLKLGTSIPCLCRIQYHGILPGLINGSAQSALWK